MTGDETLTLIAALNRAGLVYAMEGQTAVWADALSDIRYIDAVEAAKGLIRDRTSDQRSLTPGDVRAAVRRLRQKRLADAPPPLPTADPDDVAAYQAERKRLLGLLADGALTPNQIGA